MTSSLVAAYTQHTPHQAIICIHSRISVAMLRAESAFVCRTGDNKHAENSDHGSRHKKAGHHKSRYRDSFMNSEWVCRIAKKKNSTHNMNIQSTTYEIISRFESGLSQGACIDARVNRSQYVGRKGSGILKYGETGGYLFKDEESIPRFCQMKHQQEAVRRW
ncbi:hypothetical protein CISG_09700 [Coccidioides immitis RMSCC 3703]|uniref:Uncharacterized protein n=1 Tax=Coccidioides immitis RMSCC 3703 TaxID=454286 RepID=A0A0J8QKC3_COCIT|nr:hypothetical protein CISG_09700 [Coccidioides immitis RMSCC 3703]